MLTTWGYRLYISFVIYVRFCLRTVIYELLAFYQGLELSFVYGALTCISASLVIRTRDYNLAPSALMAAASKIKWGIFDKD